MSQQQNNQSPQCKKIQDYKHAHPYQYLTNLNKIYSGYNRSTVKDFSSASRIKLPFYKFSTMKVPNVFEKSYAKEKKELINYNSIEANRSEDNQKKLWKQHREIIQRYLDDKQNKKVKCSKNKNKEFVQKILCKDRNNIFLKKIIEKGTKFQYDQKKLEQEVIEKLKNIKNVKKKQLIRCQTAKCPISQTFGPKVEVRQVEQQQKVKEKDYLQFENQKDLVLKYKELIKIVDYSISEKNITKTCELLNHMQKIVDQNNYL